MTTEAQTQTIVHEHVRALYRETATLCALSCDRCSYTNYNALNCQASAQDHPLLHVCRDDEGRCVYRYRAPWPLVEMVAEL